MVSLYKTLPASWPYWYPWTLECNQAKHWALPFIVEKKLQAKTGQTIEYLQLPWRMKTSMAAECVFMGSCQLCTKQSYLSFTSVKSSEKPEVTRNTFTRGRKTFPHWSIPYTVYKIIILFWLDLYNKKAQDPIILLKKLGSK